MLKAGFRPDQLRVPKGEDGAGEWADEGGGGRKSPRLMQLAGDIPTGDTPEVPKQRPPTSRGRTAAMKTAARYGGAIGKLIEGAAWLRDRSPIIQSYRDPPKTLDELQQDASVPRPGYDRHHIVEQTQARDDGFTEEDIEGPANLALIPRMKHWDINQWYQTENSNFGGETPRDYL